MPDWTAQFFLFVACRLARVVRWQFGWSLFVLLDSPTPSRMLSYWTAQFFLFVACRVAWFVRWQFGWPLCRGFTGQPTPSSQAWLLDSPVFPLRGLSTCEGGAVAVRLDTLTFVLLDSPTPSS